SASLGLWSSMLNGPRMPPKTLTTESTTAWCSAGTTDLPVTGLTRGIVSSFRREGWQKIGRRAEDPLTLPAGLSTIARRKELLHGPPDPRPRVALSLRRRAGIRAGARAGRRLDDSLRAD